MIKAEQLLTCFKNALETKTQVLYPAVDLERADYDVLFIRGISSYVLFGSTLEVMKTYTNTIERIFF